MHALAQVAEPGGAESRAPRIVVAAGGEEPDARLGKPLELADEEQLRARGKLCIVEEIAGGQHRVQAALDGVIDGALEGLQRRAPQPIAGLRPAPEARLEVQVREVQEAEAHRLRSLQGPRVRSGHVLRGPASLGLPRCAAASRPVFAGAHASLGFASLRGRFAALREG